MNRSQYYIPYLGVSITCIYASVVMNVDMSLSIIFSQLSLNPGTPYGTYMSHVFFLHLLHEYNKKIYFKSRQFYFR